MTDRIQLPALPKALPLAVVDAGGGYSRVDVYGAEQMRAYARQAVAEALEAAALKCEKHLWTGRRHSDYLVGQTDGIAKCAAAIRAAAAMAGEE